MTDRLQELRAAGVSIWLDTLSRDLLTSGRFEALVDGCSVSGATSNPTIFAQAMEEDDSYDAELRDLLAAGCDDARDIFVDLALEDVKQAAEILRPTFDSTMGRDGFVSFECTPDVAYDTTRTITQALMLWRRLDRPNVMIKVPATPAGIPAIATLAAVGVNVNVTLLFGRERYGRVIDAYMAGLEERLRVGKGLEAVRSVASFFVSRVDTMIDRQLLPGSAPRGRVAVANAKLAYRLFEERFSTPRWQALAAQGAREQLPLWASTGTKDPAYSDVFYVEELIGPDVVNTMPEKTLRAFADHGRVERTVDAGTDEANDVLVCLAEQGIDLDAVTTVLEREGVAAFQASYDELLDRIRARAASAGFPIGTSVGPHRAA